MCEAGVVVGWWLVSWLVAGWLAGWLGPVLVPMTCMHDYAL